MDRSVLDQILDPNNTDPIVVWSESNQRMELEQIAVIPLGSMLYLLAQPIGVEGVADDEALVYRINQDSECILEVEENDMVVDLVFAEYYQMLREAGIDVPEDI